MATKKTRIMEIPSYLASELNKCLAWRAAKGLDNGKWVETIAIPQDRGPSG